MNINNCKQKWDTQGSHNYFTIFANNVNNPPTLAVNEVVSRSWQ